MRRAGFIVGVCNQLAGAAATFLLGFYLVRELTSFEFGLYGIGFAVILFLSSLANASVLVQMSIRYFDRGLGGADSEFAKSMLSIVVWVFVIPVFLLLCVIAALEELNGLVSWAGADLNYLASICVGSAGYLLREFFIRLFLLKQSEVVALGLNCLFALTLLLSVVLLKNMGCLTASSAMYAVGFCCMAAAVTGGGIAKVGLRSLGPRRAIDTMRIFRADAIWSSIGAVVIWIQGQGYVFVVSASAGVHALGELNAVRLLVAPVLFLIPAVSQVLLGKMAAYSKQGVDVLKKNARMMSIFGVCVALTYGIVVVWVRDDLSRLFLKKEGVDLSLLLAWIGYAVFQFWRVGSSVAMQVLRLFKDILAVNFFSAVLAVGLAGVLASWYGAGGAIWALLLGEAFLGVALAIKLAGKGRGA